MRKHTKKKLSLLLLLCVLLLTACGAKDEEEIYELPPEPEDGVLIYAALNSPVGKTQRRVDTFNEYHTEVQIEIRDYSDENGPQRLMVELAAGRVPDIIEMRRIGRGEGADAGYVQMARIDRPEGEYWLPYQQMAQMGYLEDLWPYIENDPELGREGVLESPLKAAEVDGGLYMLFGETSITTMAASKWLVGDRSSWALEELLETFATMPVDSTILPYNTTKREAFIRLFCTTLNQYVNWETGECSFDSEEFRSMLGFLNTFPDEFETALTPDELVEEVSWRLLKGLQLAQPVVLNKILVIPYADAIFGEEDGVALIGYPTADGGSGSFFNVHGTALAMSSTCKGKETAWEFISQLIRENYSSGTMTKAINLNEVRVPINRRDYEMENRLCMSGSLLVYPFYEPYIGGPKIPMRNEGRPDGTDLQRFETLINNTTQIYWPDNALSELVWEVCGPYFAGDKTLDDTVRLLNNRVGLYINEQK